MNNFNINLLKDVPHLPGCYLWKDINDNIIYIGKAKDLNKRMHQYFSKSHNLRISKLVNSIHNFDYFIVNNENEALILENNLIKKHQPVFNILLKDGSNNYPYILITNEAHPRIIYTRKYDPKRGKFYGPFASNDKNAFQLYVYLNKIFPLRKCNKLPNKKCMYYDIGQCLGPCINKINQFEYDNIKNQIDDLFNNKNKQIIKELKQKELKCAENLDFEKAKYYLELQKTLTNIIEVQIVELQEKQDGDYIGFYYENNILCINIFNYINGKLVSKNQIINTIYTLDIQDSVISYLIQYYSNIFLPKKIYVSLDEKNINLLQSTLNVEVIKPIKGKKFELLTQAIKNSHYFYLKNQNQSNMDWISINDEFKNIINSNHDLNYIEMIDNANIFLETNVSGLIVFKNGQPIKNMYRKFNLETVENKSDYHFMYEVVLRRYSRLIKQNDQLPDLLIVDGGLNQLNAAINALNDLNLNLNVIGLVKNNKHQTDHIILKNKQEVFIDKKSNLFLFLTKMQNEVHNYAINFFRNKNIKSKLTTFLDSIDGIGDKTKQKIIEVFPNLYDLKKANLDVLEQILNKKIALLLFNKLKDL